MEVQFKHSSNVTLKYNENIKTSNKYCADVLLHLLIYLLLISLMAVGIPKVINKVAPENTTLQVIIMIGIFILVTALFYIMTELLLTSSKFAVADLIEYLTSCEEVKAELFSDNRINFRVVRKNKHIQMQLNRLMGQLKYRIDNQCIDKYKEIKVEIDLTDVNNIVVYVSNK